MLGHRCFPVNFVKSLWTSILKNTFERLLLIGNYVLACKVIHKKNDIFSYVLQAWEKEYHTAWSKKYQLLYQDLEIAVHS